MTRYERGFTLVELLVAACITLLVTAAIVAAARPAEHVFLTQSEAADELQRSRVATSALFRDLVMAGAGPDAGPDAGSLARAFAPILPWHQGRTGGDQAGVFRDDAITLSYLPSSRAQTTIASPMPAQSGIVRVNTGAGCPLSDAACGLSQATTVLAYDDTGSADTFRVENVVDSVLELRHTSADSLKVYPVGSRLVQAIVRSYFLEADEASDQVQLVRDDGTGGPSVAIVDHVVGLKFEYFGEPDGSAVLSPAILTDGPWRPDDSAPNRFDVDLLRIRAVTVLVRVESAMAALRGPAGPLFSRAGTSRSGNRFLPDHEIRFLVSPRNMGVVR